MFWRTLKRSSGSSPDWLETLEIDLINLYAKNHGIDSFLLAAVIQTESGGNPWACRYEPQFQHTFNLAELSQLIGCSYSTMEMMQKTSWGLMQVMGSVAYELGLGAEKNDFDKWPTSLLNPYKGLYYGCLHLKEKIDRYGSAPEVAYAAYNAGSPRLLSNGMYVNQRQIDNFMRNYRALDFSP